MRHYFDTYPIEVVIEFPLGDILRNKRRQRVHYQVGIEA
jgi:hypothetical protein